MGELVPGDRGGGAALQPLLDGAVLVGVPVSRYHWVCHDHLPPQEQLLSMCHASRASLRHSFTLYATATATDTAAYF